MVFPRNNTRTLDKHGRNGFSLVIILVCEHDTDDKLCGNVRLIVQGASLPIVQSLPFVFWAVCRDGGSGDFFGEENTVCEDYGR
jgi:hypothetical protein